MKEKDSDQRQGNESETTQLFNVFPELIWHHIFEKLLDNSKDYHKICQAFPSSGRLFNCYRTQALFNDVVALMVRRLEKKDGNDSDHLQLTDLISLRPLSRCWKNGVDSALQNLSYNYKFLMEHRFPDSQFITDLAHSFSYRFWSSDNYDSFDRHFAVTHGDTGLNPFITRRIIVRLPTLPDYHVRQDLLEKFGQHVWYLHFESDIRGRHPNDQRELFNTLISILQLLPNLRVLRIEDRQTDNNSLRLTVHQFDENEKSRLVPRMPGVLGVGFPLFGNCPGTRTQEPLFVTRRVPDRYEEPVVFNYGPANRERIVPQNNAPVQPRINNSIAKLPHLRYVDQGPMPLDMFTEIVERNWSTVTQLGVSLVFYRGYFPLLGLPLKLRKLSVSLSGMEWSEFFPWLESRYGETLENLHMWLCAPRPFPNEECQLRLPNLKVLYFRHTDPAPLDFLLGVANNLEELHVKLEHMNYTESLCVQREEGVIHLYRHLNDLTGSNIWELFPKLRLVRVSNWMEIENMTPVWHCTREQWKSRNIEIEDS